MSRGYVTVWPGLVGIMREDARVARETARRPVTLKEYLALGRVVTRLPAEVAIRPGVRINGSKP